MTAQEYIQSKLEELKQPSDLPKPGSKEELIEAIFRLVMSKKFRKYSCSQSLIDDIHKAITISVDANKPINLTFLHGAYKLWSFKEAPQADWAELFTSMYYTNWLKPVCAIYEPGVWFDYFVDDLILPKLHTSSIEDSKQYQNSFQDILGFLKSYQPANLRMTINTVGDQFDSPEAFDRKLAVDIKRLVATLPNALPEVSDQRAAMIDLNVKDAAELTKDSEWLQKNTLVHDAYISFTKKEAGYHFRPDKIKVFSQQLPSGTVIALGTTKDSIAKFWVGVGALKPRDGSYRMIVLSPSQLANADFKTEPLELSGLTGKNFKQVRVLRP